MTDEETKGLTDEEKGYAIGQILGEVNPYLSIRDLVQYMDVLIVVCACQDRQQFLSGLGRGYENAVSQRKREVLYDRLISPNKPYRRPAQSRTRKGLEIQ
jgi:hypothetical protein